MVSQENDNQNRSAYEETVLETLMRHERLKNPREMYVIVLERFYHQKTEFLEAVPQEKDLGLFSVSFDELKIALTGGDPKDPSTAFSNRKVAVRDQGFR